jgi:hypothetical protein
MMIRSVTLNFSWNKALRLKSQHQIPRSDVLQPANLSVVHGCDFHLPFPGFSEIPDCCFHVVEAR